MHAIGLRSWFLVGLAAAALTVGCGSGNALYSPTAPTGAPGLTTLTADDGLAASASAAQESGFSTLGKGGGGTDGHGRDGDKDKEKEAERAERGKGGHAPDADDAAGHPGRSHEDKVEGFVSATSADTLTVRGVTVKIVPTTVIRHGHRVLTAAAIAVGDHVQARGTMNADETVLTAMEIKVEDTGDDNDDDEDGEDAAGVALRGVVAGLTTGTTGCPNLTFTVGVVTVKTGSRTTFDDVTCAALANGNIVEVKGATQLDGSVLAATVELEAGPNQVEGRIAGLAGTASCPAVTFTVGTITVTTSASTTYTGVTCATLANATKVEVEGTLSGATLAAASIEKK